MFSHVHTHALSCLAVMLAVASGPAQGPAIGSRSQTPTFRVSNPNTRTNGAQHGKPVRLTSNLGVAPPTVPPPAGTSGNPPPTLEELAAKLDKVSQQLADLTKLQQDIQGNFQDLSTKLDLLSQQVMAISKAQQQLESNFQDLARRLESLENRVKALENKPIVSGGLTRTSILLINLLTVKASVRIDGQDYEIPAQSQRQLTNLNEGKIHYSYTADGYGRSPCQEWFLRAGETFKLTIGAEPCPTQGSPGSSTSGTITGGNSRSGEQRSTVDSAFLASTSRQVDARRASVRGTLVSPGTNKTRTTLTRPASR